MQMNSSLFHKDYSIYDLVGKYIFVFYRVLLEIMLGSGNYICRIYGIFVVQVDSLKSITVL